MFDTLTSGLARIFRGVRGRGSLTARELDAIFDSARDVLLEADVAAAAARAIVEDARARAEASEGVSAPGQLIETALLEALAAGLGEGAADAEADARLWQGRGVVRPTVVALVGPPGSGKTTTCAKLAAGVARAGNRCLLATLDLSRPAAREQLETLAHPMAVLAAAAKESPQAFALRACAAARAEGYAMLVLDCPGVQGSEDLRGLAEVLAKVKPDEILLAVDSLTGQAAGGLASRFASALALTGSVLTRMDADSRGGAALSLAHGGARPRLAGVGEGLDDLEAVHPRRMARRILGGGDLEALAERAARAAGSKGAPIASRMKAGTFDLNDYAEQLRQLGRMGGIRAALALLPKRALGAASGAGAPDEARTKRQLVIVGSMTPQERADPSIFNGSRRARVARGSGATLAEVNRLLKTHQAMRETLAQAGPDGAIDPTRLSSGAASPGRVRARRKRRGTRR